MKNLAKLCTQIWVIKIKCSSRFVHHFSRSLLKFILNMNIRHHNLYLFRMFFWYRCSSSRKQVKMCKKHFSEKFHICAQSLIDFLFWLRLVFQFFCPAELLKKVIFTWSCSWKLYLSLDWVEEEISEQHYHFFVITFLFDKNSKVL